DAGRRSRTPVAGAGTGTGARRRSRRPVPTPAPSLRDSAASLAYPDVDAISRNDRIARLFRLLNLLVQTNPRLILRTIAERGDWSLRSLYRDIEALEKAGFPLVHDEGRYRLMEGWIPAVQLGVDRDELLALYLARDQAVGWRERRSAMP